MIVRCGTVFGATKKEKKKQYRGNILNSDIKMLKKACLRICEIQIILPNAWHRALHNVAVKKYLLNE